MADQVNRTTNLIQMEEVEATRLRNLPDEERYREVSDRVMVGDHEWTAVRYIYNTIRSNLYKLRKQRRGKTEQAPHPTDLVHLYNLDAKKLAYEYVPRNAHGLHRHFPPCTSGLLMAGYTASHAHNQPSKKAGGPWAM